MVNVIKSVARNIWKILILIRGNRVRVVNSGVFIGVGHMLVTSGGMNYPPSTTALFQKLFWWSDDRDNESVKMLRNLVYGTNMAVNLQDAYAALFKSFDLYMRTPCTTPQKCAVFGVKPEQNLIPWTGANAFPHGRDELPDWTDDKWVHAAFMRDCHFKVSACSL